MTYFTLLEPILSKPIGISTGVVRFIGKLGRTIFGLFRTNLP